MNLIKANYQPVNGVAKVGNGRAQDQPICFSAQPTDCQKDRYTLIEQSNILIMQSVGFAYMLHQLTSLATPLQPVIKFQCYILYAATAFYSLSTVLWETSSLYTVLKVKCMVFVLIMPCKAFLLIMLYNSSLISDNISIQASCMHPQACPLMLNISSSIVFSLLGITNGHGLSNNLKHVIILIVENCIFCLFHFPALTRCTCV